MIIHTINRLRRDERGAALVELALAAPFMAALVVGMTDLARGYSTKVQLEQAAQRTIEKVEQQKSVGTSYNSMLSTEATNALADAGYSSGNTITPDSWLECSSDGTTWTRQSDFNGSCPNATDTTARYVSIRISRNFSPLFTSRAWPGANSDGTFTVSGYAEVRIQ
jgi:Flp pilus assembly protein TadG